MWVLAGVAAAALAGPAGAQSLTAEADVTAGYSTQGDTAAGTTQLRLFGDFDRSWRFFVEGSAALRSGPRTDAFSGAYPYEPGATLMEAYAERNFRLGSLQAGVRAGRFRTPFGLYGRGEHAYSGFLRAPLIRYGRDYALSNYWMEGGADAFIGTPHLQLEASVGAPQDASYARRAGLDTTVRLQGYTGPFILGASYLSTRPSTPYFPVTGHAEFVGVDARWMRGGTQIRGEWLTGRPFAGARTDGWYLDTLVHRPFMGPVTAVARYEELFYYAGPFSFTRRRATVGAKVRLSSDLVGHANLLYELPGAGVYDTRTGTALDVALTYTFRTPTLRSHRSD